jgi:hypothetical protein
MEYSVSDAGALWALLLAWRLGAVREGGQCAVGGEGARIRFGEGRSLDAGHRACRHAELPNGR